MSGRLLESLVFVPGGAESNGPTPAGSPAGTGKRPGVYPNRLPGTPRSRILFADGKRWTRSQSRLGPK